MAESDEQRKVRKLRYLEAREAGLSKIEARLYADSDISSTELRRLVAAGCAPELIGRIIL